MVIRDSDLVAIVPGMLAEEYVSHVPIKVLPMPVPVPPFDLRVYWHERYHHDAPIRWLRNVFVELFRVRARSSGR
jgi:DNA-binding transcriptional LysR family regulator